MLPEGCVCIIRLSAHEQALDQLCWQDAQQDAVALVFANGFTGHDGVPGKTVLQVLKTPWAPELAK